MKIILFDIDKDMIDAWNKFFKDRYDVEVLHSEFKTFMNDRGDVEVDTIVAAGNSYGVMNGGLDQVYIDYFGSELQVVVANSIKQGFDGFLPVGVPLKVNIPKSNKMLFYVPTMEQPESILDHNIIYKCMFNTLDLANMFGSKVIMIPAFGHLTGRVPSLSVAQNMYRAYNAFKNPVGL